MGDTDNDDDSINDDKRLVHNTFCHLYPHFAVNNTGNDAVAAATDGSVCVICAFTLQLTILVMMQSQLLLMGQCVSSVPSLCS